MSYSSSSSHVIPSIGGQIHTLDNANSRCLMKIYCACGRIVDLDKKEMKLKLTLKKDTECTLCRNMRISRDIEGLNDHFDGNFAEDQELLF